jgi:oligoendopeptidase F
LFNEAANRNPPPNVNVETTVEAVIDDLSSASQEFERAARDAVDDVLRDAMQGAGPR